MIFRSFKLFGSLGFSLLNPVALSCNCSCIQLTRLRNPVHKFTSPILAENRPCCPMLLHDKRVTRATYRRIEDGTDFAYFFGSKLYHVAHKRDSYGKIIWQSIVVYLYIGCSAFRLSLRPDHRYGNYSLFRILGHLRLRQL